VLFFFVLSGFVLSQSFISGTPLSYKNFVIRRFCRIYLPFVLSIAIAAVLASFFVLPISESHDPNFWSRPVDAPLILAHVVMIGIGADSVTLNPPMWSLIQEMRISLAFPIIYLIAQRFGWLGFAGNLIASIIVVKLAAMSHLFTMALYGDTALGSLMVTLYYTQFFTLGCVLAINREKLVGVFLSAPKLAHIIAVATILLVPWRFLEDHFHIGELFCTFAAAYLLIACIAFRRMKEVLLTGPLQWLGEISYSLYLVHMPVLLAVYFALRGHLSDMGICATIIASSLVGAHIFNLLIERPATKLGRILSPSRGTTRLQNAPGE
jgi:peptidoglycan/LPS O-acetylase OafA/YrhL